MADSIIAFPPDSTDPAAKRVVFNKNTIPGISGEVFYQYVRLAQPPTYIAVANNIPCVSGKNHLTLYNRTGVRLRVEHVYSHPFSLHQSGTNTILQVGVTVTEPNGSDITINKLSSDFVNNPAAPNNVMAKAEMSGQSLIAGYILGGGVVNTQIATSILPRDNTILFNKDKDHSSIQLLSGQGIVVRQDAVPVSGAGSISTYCIFTLDTA